MSGANLSRDVACKACPWTGKNGDLIARDRLRCPKCDSDQIRYFIAEAPEQVQ